MTAARLRLASFYAALFGIYGVQLPFWPVFLAGRGLGAVEIGTLLALGQWIKLAANPLAGWAADRGPAPRRIMLLLSLAALAGFALLLPVRGLAPLLLLATATSACLSAVLPLGDAVALAAAYAGRLDYGRVRLWGSLGFILAALGAGVALRRAASGPDLVLYLLVGGTAALALACLVLPKGPAPAAAAARLGWRALARPRLLWFLLAAALIQGSHGVYYAFGTLHWQRLGIADDVIAALWAEGVLAEIALFYWGATLLRRVGPLGLLALGGGAGLMRWSGTAFATTLPALALLQLLHGFTFGAAHLGAMHHLARSVPAERAASGQALYTVVVGGVGPGLVALLAGALYATAGGLAFLAMAALAGLGAAVALRLATKS